MIFIISMNEKYFIDCSAKLKFRQSTFSFLKADAYQSVYGCCKNGY
jgi:hypothetical protein